MVCNDLGRLRPPDIFETNRYGQAKLARARLEFESYESVEEAREECLEVF